MKNSLMFALSLLAALVFNLANAGAVTVTDDFSDLNDTANPVWTHLSGDANSSGQTWDASTGEYHIIAPSNSVPAIGGVNYGFAGSYTGPTYTDVTLSADLTQLGSGIAWGLGARLDGNNGFNALKGYGYIFEQDLNAAPGVGEMVMAKINGLNISDMGQNGTIPGVDYQRFVTLDPNKDYTMTLSIIGNTLFGTVKEVGGPIVAFQSKTDATYASGFSGVFGYGGKLTTGPLTDYQLNFWVDNFSTADVPEPATILLLACGIGAMASIRRRRSRN
jgi:hypothetical protein